MPGGIAVPRVEDIVQKLSLKVLAGQEQLTREVTGGYVSDLLSDVMAHAGEGNVWVTTQAHQNIVAVGCLVGISAIIVSGGIPVEPAACDRANQEGIPILSTDLPSFEVVGRLYELGIRGDRVCR